MIDLESALEWVESGRNRLFASNWLMAGLDGPEYSKGGGFLAATIDPEELGPNLHAGERVIALMVIPSKANAAKNKLLRMMSLQFLLVWPNQRGPARS